MGAKFVRDFTRPLIVDQKSGWDVRKEGNRSMESHGEQSCVLLYTPRSTWKEIMDLYPHTGPGRNIRCHRTEKQSSWRWREAKGQVKGKSSRAGAELRLLTVTQDVRSRGSGLPLAQHAEVPGTVGKGRHPTALQHRKGSWMSATAFYERCTSLLDIKTSDCYLSYHICNVSKAKATLPFHDIGINERRNICSSHKEYWCNALSKSESVPKNLKTTDYHWTYKVIRNFLDRHI